MKRMTLFLAGTVHAHRRAVQPAKRATDRAAGPHIWLDAPLDGSAVALLAPLEVVSHSSDPMRIVQVELSVNGAVLRTDANSDTQKPLVTMRQQWMPPAPGNIESRCARRTQAAFGATMPPRWFLWVAQPGPRRPSALGRLCLLLRPSALG